MQKQKVAAALAAVQLYLQQEADEAALAAAVAQSATPVRDSEPGQWALAGRFDMMSGRRMMQMRAIAHAR